MKFNVSAVKRIFLFVCISFLCYIITAVILGFVLYKWPGSAPAVRIAAIVQDIMLFILPALATAMVITRLPATFLCIDRKPIPNVCALGVLALLFSMPAMEWLVQWNMNISLPEGMKPLEEWMRQAEAAASSQIELLLGGHSVGSLIIGILVVGIMAALSEELFFRGALQRLISTIPVNKHVAIWIAAFLFSAFHMQFYGFFPRLLLGAFFGYALVWSGSLWVPVILHATNNTLYVLNRYLLLGTGIAPENVSEVTLEFPMLLTILSVVLTIMFIFLMRHVAAKHNISKTFSEKGK